MKLLLKLILTILLLASTQALIELELDTTMNEKVCTVLISSFDVLS